MKMATVVDLIPPKITLAGSKSLSVPIWDMTVTIINRMKWPEKLKLAQVTHINKKDYPFIEKFRPVSILQSLSKLHKKSGQLVFCHLCQNYMKGSLQTSLFPILKIYFISFLQYSVHHSTVILHC